MIEREITPSFNLKMPTYDPETPKSNITSSKSPNNRVVRQKDQHPNVTINVLN